MKRAGNNAGRTPRRIPCICCMNHFIQPLVFPHHASRCRGTGVLASGSLRVGCRQGPHGQIHKYFYRDILKARWCRKKTLGGILGGTIGIKKIIIPNPIPCPGGRENSKSAKNGGKMDIFNEKSIFLLYLTISCPQ